MTSSPRVVAAVVGAAIVGSVVTAAVFLIARGGGNGEDGERDTSASSATASSTTPATALGDTRAGAGGAELVALLTQGRTSTFHASYKASAPGGSPNQQVVLELWRKPPKEREEIVQSSGTQSIRTAGFLIPPQSVLCRKVDAAPWTCANAPQAAGSSAEGLVKGVTDELAKQASAGRDDVIATRPVRCFSVPTGGQQSELCLTKEGVTARVSTAGSSIELVALSFEVPDDAFVPHAPPTG